MSLGLPTLLMSAAAGLPPDFDIERVERDLRWLVEDIGPRVAGSAEEEAAAEGVRKRLRKAGWTPTDIGKVDNVVACRGTPNRLFLAHTDTVEGSPGAIDNGAGVAVLLELARTSQAKDLCLGFPVAEELGLVGSMAMAAQIARGHPIFPDGIPRLTVAMDLAGQGRLGVMGLGPAWTDERLGWLADTLDPVPETPFAYQVYSRMMPWAERSDHAPFAWYGGLSLHLLGLGDSDVFPAYHQPEDTSWDRPAVLELASALEQLATAPLPAVHPPPEEEPQRDRAVLGAGALVMGRHVPGWLVWTTLIAGFVAAATDWRKGLKGLPRQLLVGLLAAAIAAAHMALVTVTGLFSSTQGEATAAAVMGAEATGWWLAAPFGVGLAALLWLATRHVFGGKGSASFGAGISAALVLWLDPVFALPFGLAALLGRLHPLLALIPAAYLLRPSALRQFTFHGLAPPLLWGLVWLLAWPAVVRTHPHWRWPRASGVDSPSPHG